MAEGDISELLESVPFTRRRFAKRMIAGAFALPTIVSFSAARVAQAHAPAGPPTTIPPKYGRGGRTTTVAPSTTAAPTTTIAGSTTPAPTTTIFEVTTTSAPTTTIFEVTTTPAPTTTTTFGP